MDKIKTFKQYDFKIFKSLIIEKLDKLTDDERLEIFEHYCKYCETKYKPCYCMRDD